ncbi:MAG: AMP-binding protein [Alphaproteobacteria bacterium]|nr:AMP-binding protein [Alphaproteobacteria bacterium]
MTDNLYSLFASRFAPHQHRACFVDADGGAFTFGALEDLSARFAAVLRARGVGAGDRVVAQTEKSVGAVALYLACLRIGALYAPLNTAYTPAEVDYFLRDAEPAAFVTGRARKADAGCVLELGEGPDTPLWAEALATAPDGDLAACSADDIAAILYTSGTTGRSKGAMLSIENLRSNALALHALWGFGPDDVLLHALPIFHVHGLFIALHCALLNATPTLFLPKFDAVAVRALLPKASVLMGVPTFYTRLLALQDFGAEDCRAMRVFISGSAPLLAETHAAFEQRTGHRILERYGMSEACIITSNPLDGDRIPGTVGYPLPGVSLRVAGEDGRVCEPGAPGMIEIKGPNVFRGYWRMPEKTAQEFREDGFFITGDVGVQAADGRVSIVGRAKDMIISGGYNIYPIEIEAALDAIDGVIESAVIGAPHPDFGEAVVAVLACRPGAAPDQAAIEAALHEKLARFKHPRRFVFVDDLPRNAMGKVQKAALRQSYGDSFAG